MNARLQRIHFRDTEEWQKKRRRIITKMRTVGRLRLALILSKMPVGPLALESWE